MPSQQHAEGAVGAGGDALQGEDHHKYPRSTVFSALAMAAMSAAFSVGRGDSSSGSPIIVLLDGDCVKVSSMGHA